MVEQTDATRCGGGQSDIEIERELWVARAEKRAARRRYFLEHGRYPGVLGYLGHLHRVGVAGWKEGRRKRKAIKAHPLYWIRRLAFWLWLAGALGAYAALVEDRPHMTDFENDAAIALAAAWPGVIVGVEVDSFITRMRKNAEPEITPIADAERVGA